MDPETFKVTPEMRIEGDHRLISIFLIPVYNEEGNIRKAYETVRDIFELLKDRYTFEIIFTDNHSTDGSFAIITELARSDTRVRGVRFARNFGFQRSVLTGYRLASGDAAIQLDCDLQDPPYAFPAISWNWGSRDTTSSSASGRFGLRVGCCSGSAGSITGSSSAFPMTT